jgi:plasmid stabilization system protein ParE
MTFTIRSQAHRDIAEAVEYYLGEQTPQSADRFADAVDVAYDGIINAPYRNRVVQYGLREKKLKGFPYAVLYSVEESGIVIVAIYHDRRKRSKLRGRI